ncbi:MAG: hypothetical protein KDA91_17280 [Planctomycetaceae bacterium]|nr:hypothetical protein [Planctomycetaceae bacterium]
MAIRKTRKRARYTDTFIREVRANYQQTASMLFTIKGPNDVADFVRSVLTDNSREHCVALYLDGAHQVVSYSIISIGTANMAVVHPREVFFNLDFVRTASFGHHLCCDTADRNAVLPSFNNCNWQILAKLTKQLRQAGRTLRHNELRPHMSALRQHLSAFDVPVSS